MRQELRLVDVLVQIVGELASRCLVVTERLLDDDPPGLRQPGLGEPLDDRAEEERRDLEVEDGRLSAGDGRAHALVHRRVREVSGHVREPSCETVEHARVDASRRFPRWTRGRER